MPWENDPLWVSTDHSTSMASDTLAGLQQWFSSHSETFRGIGTVGEEGQAGSSQSPPLLGSVVITWVRFILRRNKAQVGTGKWGLKKKNSLKSTVVNNEERFGTENCGFLRFPN